MISTCWILLTLGIIQVNCFRNIPHLNLKFAATSLDSTTTTATITDTGKSWQEDVDSILNVDTPCESRKEIVSGLLKKSDQIIADVSSAVQDRDTKKIAPPSLGYGKAVEGLKAFRRQLLSDLIPDFILNDGPKLFQDAPKRIENLITNGPEKINKAISQSQKLVSSIVDISQDPSLLQSTLDDIRREAKNIVKSVPEGLETPLYEVLKKTDSYEIRSYSSYSVCSTKLESDLSSMSTVANAQGFNTLAGYLFGDNNKDSSPEKMAMTTPVIISNGEMEFVLPSDKTAANAPAPVDSNVISIKDIAAEVVAVREFPGIATDGEVTRQRALLEDALLGDGILYDNLSFKVLQYNPPYTLPWLRRNEVSLSVTYAAPVSSITSEAPIDDIITEDSSTFFSSPEAGD
jgi:hypothetical protein